MLKERLTGVFAAAVTPLTENLDLDSASLARLLSHLRADGCHGVLIAGSTGEGMSLSIRERAALFQAARSAAPTMPLIAGTGAASLSDAIEATRAAYAAGFDAALILPPFFFPDPGEEGLFNYFSRIFERAVPPGQAALLYHNPEFAPPVSLDLIARLRARFGPAVAGIKDSSNDVATALAFCAIPDFWVVR